MSGYRVKYRSLQQTGTVAENSARHNRRQYTGQQNIRLQQTPKSSARGKRALRSESPRDVDRYKWKLSAGQLLISISRRHGLDVTSVNENKDSNDLTV